MKRYSLMLLFVGLLVNVLLAQAPTKLNVTLLNNHFNNVNLVTAYGSSQKNFGSADIENGKFTMQVSLPNDIYKLDFGNGSSMLVVITPGETLTMTLDAENLQEPLSVSGSPSMSYVKDMAHLANSRKTAIDSINEALQKDETKIYWSDFAQRLNLYRQTNDDVDNYLLDAYDNLDTLLCTFSRSMSGGKIKNSEMFDCADAANRMLKKTEIDYTPFVNYQENVDKYYTFPTKKMPNEQDFYVAFDQYQYTLKQRHQVAEQSIGAIMPLVKSLLAERDSLAYNNLWDKKSSQTKWTNHVLSELYPKLPAVVGEKENYENFMQKSDKAFVNSLVSQSQEKVSQVVAKYQKDYNEIDAYISAKLKEGIREHKNDVAVLMFLDMFPREQNAALHSEVITALHDVYPEHLIVKDRWNYMNSPASKVAIGAIAPDLEFPDPDGKMRKLSDLRGKVVLLDFWASWCGPCRRENPNVTRIYSLYHDKGFEVFSVSLDRDAASWKRAIESDKLVWPNHVSDLKQWQSQAAAIYGVRSIPSTFLLDKEGRIVQRDLRGADLERAVKQLVEQQ